MSKVIDIKNQRFGKLLVLEKLQSNKKGCMVWKCRCDCGNIVEKSGDLLRRGSVKSCGCFFDEKKKFGNPKHEKSNTRIYRIWSEMKTRCYLKTCNIYKNYGGRGITICKEWLDDFMNFYNWAMSNGYTDELTIDRIDVNGNYEPSNCRWATNEIQQNNKRNNRIIVLNGVSHTLSEWSKITGINGGTISKRIKSGWTIERALEQKTS